MQVEADEKVELKSMVRTLAVIIVFFPATTLAIRGVPIFLIWRKLPRD